MAEVLTLSYATPIDASSLDASVVTAFALFRALIEHLFRKGNNERDANLATVIVICQPAVAASSGSGLDGLAFADKKLLLRYFFCHLNVVVIQHDKLAPGVINAVTRHVALHVGQRIPRVEAWTGTGRASVDDMWEKILTEWEHAAEERTHLVLPTMLHILIANTNKSAGTTARLRAFNALMVQEITFVELLHDRSPRHLALLCGSVGNWLFPAHELSNDDLVYCVFAMLKYGMEQTSERLDDNALLGFVFMVRDTYKCGNPFHNFRHAADVLQACFHFLVRLGCLPMPHQMNADAISDEAVVVDATVLVSTGQTMGECQGQPATPTTIRATMVTQARDEVEAHLLEAVNIGHLSPMELFGLLVAAIGHDVGHPGVTNAFMTKFASPMLLIYNGRLVLELFHLAVFINKVLAVAWPLLLEVRMEGLTMRDLIISSILATDMAEHFEYIDKITMFKSSSIPSLPQTKVKLMLLLLIKCADILNVTRPLRVLLQWALALTREFEEVGTLEKRILQCDGPLNLDPVYPRLPATLDKVIETQRDIFLGQIFFIDTFAENLFKRVAGILPELQFTCDVILTNKAYWYGFKLELGD